MRDCSREDQTALTEAGASVSAACRNAGGRGDG